MISSGYLRISLRGMLVLVTMFAIGCLALKNANTIWQTSLSAIVMLAVMGALIIALVDRGPRQMTAIGFFACVLTYAVLLNGYSQEFDPYTATLPTSKVMLPIFQLIAKKAIIDGSTGKVVPAPKVQPITTPRGTVTQLLSVAFPNGPQPLIPGPGGWSATAGAIPFMAVQTELPQRGHFMAVAHHLWALLFGYAGSLFAKFVYARRQTIPATN